MTGTTTSTHGLRPPRRQAELAAIEALLDRLAADHHRACAVLRPPPGPSPGRDAVRGRAAFARGLLELHDGPMADAGELLLLAVRLLAPHDRRLALDALLAATEAAWASGDVPAYRATLAHAAGLHPVPAPLAYYLAGMTEMMKGRFRHGSTPLRRTVENARGATDSTLLLRACVAALVLGDLGAARDAAARALAVARTAGQRTLVPQALEYLAYSELRAGHHARARVHAEEGLRTAAEAGQRNAAAHHHAILAMAASVEGTAQECAHHARAASETAVPHGLGVAETLAGWALARSDLGEGRPREAAARLAPLVRPSPRGGHYAARMLAVPCFVEAAVLSGATGGVTRAVEEFAAWAAWTEDPQTPGRLARCRALLAATEEEADVGYAYALVRHDDTGGDFERARTELLYGKALRRRRRLLDARDRLRGALIGFERCGAGAWADQARAELRATGAPGESGRGAEPDVLRSLTPQQLRIARCVAEGATNREVAVRLSVSPRTVEHHLRNVFAALGVRSRVELARLVGGGPDGDRHPD